MDTSSRGEPACIRGDSGPMLNRIQSRGELRMATTFVIACPDCGKQVKVSDAHVGKKVKCKECGAVYPVKAPAGAAGPPPGPGKGKPTQAKAPAAKGTQVKPPSAPTKAEVEAPAAPADVPS